MKNTHALTSLAGAAAMTASLLVAAPATAAPDETPHSGTVTHCVLTSNGSTCGSPAAMRAKTAKQPLLFAIHDKKNQNGDFRAFYGKRCSTPTAGKPDYNLPLGFMAKRGESVTKGANSRCNWQLVGAKGKKSTWVEGSRANLGNIGSGWNNRAVRVRLT